MKIMGYFRRDLSGSGLTCGLTVTSTISGNVMPWIPLSPQPTTYRCKVKFVTSPARKTCTATVSPGSNSPRRNM